MRLIDADALREAMYDEAFENDESYNETNPMARWDSGLWIRYKMFENVIDEQPTIESKQGENATRCYEFLKTKLGEGIVDSKKEFESWYERMVWHVKECDKLAREPKQGEWIPCSERLPEEAGRYLCTVGASYRNPREMYYAPQEWADKSDHATWRSIDGNYVFDWFVEAWQQLPEPWEGADDERL